MEIVIVSKTQMTSNECVGGICRETGKFVRLLDMNGDNQTIDCEFEIGEIWEIEFKERYNVSPPHMEDILIISKSLTQKKGSKADLANWIINSFSDRVWNGSPDNLFEELIQFTSNGSGYISHKGGVPYCSVGFWVADKDLIRRDFKEKVRYNYPSAGNWRNIPYVGKDAPIERIPVGTLMRVSLARWWTPDGSDQEARCYLQLSGWYLD